jgi:hypothetical protein
MLHNAPAHFKSAVAATLSAALQYLIPDADMRKQNERVQSFWAVRRRRLLMRFLNFISLAATALYE